LTALGVTRATVTQDYLATAQLWQPDERLRAQIPAAAHPAVFGVESAYLDAAFDELAKLPGGVQGFVRDALGGEAAHRAFVERHVKPG
jgi:protein-tyrosine phosphatase